MSRKEIDIRGKITAVEDGEKKINSNFTAGYRSLRIKVGRKYYRVFLSNSQINKYGVLPKEGMWVHIAGILKLPENEYFDPVIKNFKIFEHTDPPLMQQIIEKYNRSS